MNISQLGMVFADKFVSTRTSGMPAVRGMVRWTIIFAENKVHGAVGSWIKSL